MKTINNILHRTLPYLSYLPHTYLINVKATFQPTNKPLFHPALSLPSSHLLYSTLSILLPYLKSTIDYLNHLTHTVISILFPLPTTILKKISNQIYPSILSIFNLSITSGTFPSTLKSSVISPLLKTSTK